jgi:hypothetical protein
MIGSGKFNRSLTLGISQSNGYRSKESSYFTIVSNKLFDERNMGQDRLLEKVASQVTREIGHKVSKNF